MPSIDELLPAETSGPDETVRLGTAIADCLEPGDTIALIGDLGAGKTQLVRGIASGLGVDPGDVTSPTFTIAHEYHGDVDVFHLDLYRLETPEDVRNAGLDEYFDPDGVCLIEWPERAGRLLPPETTVLRMQHLGGDRRRIARVELLEESE